MAMGAGGGKMLSRPGQMTTFCEQGPPPDVGARLKDLEQLLLENITVGQHKKQHKSFARRISTPSHDLYAVTEAKDPE